ncbi:DsbA family oxidoreductase [Hoeflea alexandrii]|nr:DsbA family protein [Hoeflea alexandrii]
MMATLTIDFFHDVVCCWCFNISSRMRSLAREFDLDIRHRSFVLQASRKEMAARWGTPAEARETILGHWSVCRDVSDRPDLIDVEAMRLARFDYPHGFEAALACKAAEAIGGQAAHWDLFDRIQLAHLAEARDIADRQVLAEAARDIGLDAAAFVRAIADPATAQAVEADRQAARLLQVRSIPALIIRDTGARLVNGPVEHLRAQLRAAAHLVA